MTTTHTPGPWGYNTENGEIFYDDGDVLPRIADVDLSNLCDTSEAQGHADGHLIAAAPDMLAALQRAAYFFDTPVVKSEENAIRGEVLAAIAKATGAA